MPMSNRAGRGTMPMLFLIVTIIMVGLNFRAPILAMSPVLEQIIDSTGISGTVAGMLTTIPVICFGLISPFAPALARRFGMEAVLAGIFVVLVGGILLRSAPPLPALFAGTVVIGAAIAIGNVILPGFVKREAPNRIGPMTAIYSAAISGSGALGAGITLPLMNAFELDWRGGLRLTAISAAAVIPLMLVWLVRARGNGNIRLRTHASTGLWRNHLAWFVTIYMGTQSLLFFSVSAWLPTYFIAQGMEETRAGFMLSISPLFGMAGSFIAPLLVHRRKNQRWLIWLSSALVVIGITGILLAPMTLTVFWVATFGFGSGSTLSLALTFIGLRTPDSRHASDLSSMSQSVGYGLAALGPLLVGVIRDLSGGWTLPMLFILAMTVPLLLAGLIAAQDRLVAPVPDVSP